MNNTRRDEGKSDLLKADHQFCNPPKIIRVLDKLTACAQEQTHCFFSTELFLTASAKLTSDIVSCACAATSMLGRNC